MVYNVVQQYEKNFIIIKIIDYYDFVVHWFSTSYGANLRR